MSQFNGDKARFHRERKQNERRRLRTRELLQAAGLKVSPPEASQEAPRRCRKTRILKLSYTLSLQQEELYEEAVCWQHPPQHH